MEYQTVIKNVRAAISRDNDVQNKWKVAGNSVADFYGSESALVEVKAQFIADSILPELDKRHAQALALQLPRKNSAEYVTYVGTHGAEKWEAANQAKKDARATCDTYFSRVVKYAFPTEKAERVPTDTKTKLVELINDAIKKVQKDAAPSYDAVAILAHLNSALAVVK